MMRDAIGRAALLVAGSAILASAALHGLVNVPHLHGDLLEIGVRRTLVGAVMLVLYFSVIAMFAFGGLVISGALGSLRGARHLAPLWIVAVTYIAFGVTAFLLVSRTPHMLGYAVMGALVAVGAVLRPGRAADGIPGGL
jgi:hypothetical protein